MVRLLDLVFLRSSNGTAVCPILTIAVRRCWPGVDPSRIGETERCSPEGSSRIEDYKATCVGSGEKNPIVVHSCTAATVSSSSVSIAFTPGLMEE